MTHEEGLGLYPNNLIIDDTLYYQGVDFILCLFLVHKESEKKMNDCHADSCGGHLYGLATI